MAGGEAGTGGAAGKAGTQGLSDTAGKIHVCEALKGALEREGERHPPRRGRSTSTPCDRR
jgi:hypothetical protein